VLKIAFQSHLKMLYEVRCIIRIHKLVEEEIFYSCITGICNVFDG